MPTPTPEIVRLQTEIAWAQHDQDLLSSALDMTLAALQVCLYRIEALESRPSTEELCMEPRGHSISLGQALDELEAELAELREEPAERPCTCPDCEDFARELDTDTVSV